MPSSLTTIGSTFMQESNSRKTSTTIPACNTPCLAMIFLDVLPMLCLIDGEGLSSRGGSSCKQRKRKGLHLTCLPSITWWVLMISPEWVVSGLRKKDGGFINVSPSLKIPPLTEIRELIYASQEIEKCEEEDVMPEKKWIAQLIQPGTSLGGARPKAGVLDEEGRLCIAKFPSRNDDYDAGLWEHFSHLLALQAGIHVAETRLWGGLGKYHTLLSKRFDRTDEGRRIHFASCMSLLGLKDGDNAQGGYGYLDIVDFILQGCCDVETNLRELYRRVAFNICIGNSDDHFRNHGFLLTPKGWTLSPAYDMNPTNNLYQSLLINAVSNKADIQVLLESCEDYMINRKVAQGIIKDVQTAVSNWEVLAKQLQIPQREQAMFKDRFKFNLNYNESI